MGLFTKTFTLRLQNPEFLKMFIYANDYSSYGGNKIENYVYKKLKDGSIDVFIVMGQPS